VALIRIHGDETFKVLVEGLLESYEHKKQLFQVHWEGWAVFWDWMCITVLIPSYTGALVILFYYSRVLDESPVAHSL